MNWDKETDPSMRPSSALPVPVVRKFENVTSQLASYYWYLQPNIPTVNLAGSHELNTNQRDVLVMGS